MLHKLVQRVQADVSARRADEREDGDAISTGENEKRVVIVRREVPLCAIAVRAGSLRFRLPDVLAKLFSVQIDAPLADVRSWSRIRL